MAPKSVFLTFSGGAALGTEIAGAGEECENILADLGIVVQGFAGTSVGALFATLRVFGMSWSRIKDITKELLHENALLDFSVEGIPGGAVTKWEVLKEIAERELGRNTTFGEAPKALVVCCTNADTAEPFYFSKIMTPRVKVCEVMTRTSSFALPVTDMDTVPSLGTEMTPDIRLFYDGGWVNNTCDDAFDRHAAPRIAFRLDRRGIQRVRKGDYPAMWRSYMRAVFYASGAWKTQRQDGLNFELPVVYDTGFDFSKTPDQIDKEWALGAKTVRDQRSRLEDLFM